jgi:hypothetical protein
LRRFPHSVHVCFRLQWTWLLRNARRARGGVMHSVVQRLTIDDMLAIAAYVASREP